MAKGKKTARAARIRRHLRVRKKVLGKPDRPRLAVFRSLNHIYAQVIDDSRGRTLVAASDLEAALRARGGSKKKTEVAALVGQAIGEEALAVGITRVVLDRGGFRYHGRVKALAEAARGAGLQF